MSLSKSLTKRPVVALEFDGYSDAPTYEGKNTVFTFKLKKPISKLGSTLHDNLNTREKGVPTQIVDAEVLKIIDTDLDLAADDFIKEIENEGTEEETTVITGYKGNSLVLDVSKPKYNRLDGEETQPVALWLRSKKFSEVDKITMSTPKKM